MSVTVCHSRTSPTETQQFATGAFFEFLILAVGIHLFSVVYVMYMFAEQVAYWTVKPSASHYTARRQNRHVAVAAMTAVVNGIGIRCIWNPEQPLFVKEQCPKMIFQVKGRATILVLLEFLPDSFQEIPVFQRFNVCTFFKRGRAITSECENI